MSAPAFAWAMEQGASLRLSPSERLVLLYLADKANGSRVCWPGQETIERFTGLAQKTIRAAIAGLVRAALIAVDKRPGIVTRYHILRPVTPVNGSGVDQPDPGNPSGGDHANPGKMYPTTPVNGAVVTPVNCDVVDPESHPQPRYILPVTPVNRRPEPVLNQVREERKKDTHPLPLSHREGECVSPPEDASASKRTDRLSYPPDFDAFWLAYPRKAGKRAALKGWAGAVARAGGAAAIMAGLASHRFAHEERYIPHPSTWLNRDQWLDEQDSFDPVLRAVGLTPEDFADWPVPEGRLLQ